MNNLKKLTILSLLVFTAVVSTAAQDRQRIVKQTSSRPLNQPTQPIADKTKPLTSSIPLNNSASNRPVLTNRIEVAKVVEAPKSLIAKTGINSPLHTVAAAVAAGRTVYSSAVSNTLMSAIQQRLGIPYLYGSSGPNRYDCSGFVWAAFSQAGMPFERTSARSLWQMSEAVSGDERFKFGTLVFFNGLGHMGIVADAEGFYHSSSSKGVTYSKFDGYWGKRIVGFRRLVQNVPTLPAVPAVQTAQVAEAK